MENASEKTFLVLTNKNRKIVIRADSIIAAKSILERYTAERLKGIRKLKLTDLINKEEYLLVLPSRDYI